MRIGLQTWGTEGDIRPCGALAEALTRRGHQVRLVYTNVEGRDFRALAAPTVEMVPVGTEYFAAQRARITARAAENFKVSNPVTQLGRIFEDTLDPVVDAMFEAGREVARWADVVVGHFLAHPAFAAAEVERRAMVSLAFAPVIPTRHHGPMGAPRLGRWFNPALWWVADRAMNSVLGERVNVLRRRAGLRVVRDASAQLRAQPGLSLVATSGVLFPRPADWPERARVCGVLEHEVAPEPLTPELAAFVDAEPAPVFFTLGSMANLDEERALGMVLAVVSAARHLGARLVVQAPAGVLARVPVGPTVFATHRAPHSVVFPKCAAVVHHGGAGTTHAVLRAGRPSIVIPHIADQFFWADALARLGVGAAPLVATRVSERGLAERLEQVLRNPSYAEFARELAPRVRAEQGPATAAQWIEEFTTRTA